MDYHFNLRQGTHKKFRMSPFLPSSGFERCYSTRSGVDFGSITNNGMAMPPVVELIPDCHVNKSPFEKTNLLKKASNILSPMTSSMSVSYIVGGFVTSQAKTEPNSSNFNLFDVLVNSFHSRDPVNMKLKEANSGPFPDNCSPAGMKVVSSEIIPNGAVTQKRTYADVAKGVIPASNMIQKSATSTQSYNRNSEMEIHSKSMLPGCPTDNCYFNNHSFFNKNMGSEPFNLKLPLKPCSNISLTNRDHPAKSQSCILTGNSKRNYENCDFLAPVEKLIPSTSLSHHSVFKLPISSSNECHRINRTLSECSVDSDDSFVVFQHEDDAIYDSLSEDESSSDDSFEDGHQYLSGVVSSVSVPEKKTKKVTFKPDDQLVEVHNMVKWDYAHRAARIGPWETYARDRDRFEKRICQVSQVLSPILEPSHRAAIFKERFLNNN